MRDFSSRYGLIIAPRIRRLLVSNMIFTYLPKRLLLWLRSVLALPKASRAGLQATILCSMPFLPALQPARKEIAIFAVSVFPAPDSPLITMPCLSFSVKSWRRARAAMA